jgi:hypothetical protein
LTNHENVIHKGIDAFIPSWHEFENCSMVEIELLHSQPFMNCHLHSFVVVESVMMGQVHQSVGGDYVTKQ